MRAVARRVLRLENRLHVPGNPRQRLRLIARRMDREPGLENATCQRPLYADGTLFELVRLDRRAERRGLLTNEQLERWVASFPVQSCAAGRPGETYRYCR